MSTIEDPALEARGLGKSFPARGGRADALKVIEDLTFAVAPGELLTIVGPSGAGKSTLLNILAQIDVLNAGEVRFAGETMRASNGRDLRPGWGCRMGYVTQDDNLLPWRTLIDNVLFPLRVQGTLGPETRKRAHLLLEATGLNGFERYYPHELSGGMRKRASLIRTLVYDPPVILMDEPFGALDAQTRTQLQADLLRLWNLGRKTIVFVTHDIAEAIALGDRTLVLTRAPTRIASEHRIDIPRPRDVARLFGLPGFATLYERVRRELQ